jgi:hypothetical protein
LFSIRRSNLTTSFHSFRPKPSRSFGITNRSYGCLIPLFRYQPGLNSEQRPALVVSPSRIPSLEFLPHSHLRREPCLSVVRNNGSTTEWQCDAEVCTRPLLVVGVDLCGPRPGQYRRFPALLVAPSLSWSGGSKPWFGIGILSMIQYADLILNAESWSLLGMVLAGRLVYWVYLRLVISQLWVPHPDVISWFEIGLWTVAANVFRVQHYVSTHASLMRFPFARNIASDRITRSPQYSKTMLRIAELMVDLFSWLCGTLRVKKTMKDCAHSRIPKRTLFW